MFEFFISKLESHPFLSIPGLGIWFIYPFIAIIYCWIRKDGRIYGRLFWTFAIILSLPFGSWGAIIFSLLYFKNLLGKLVSFSSLIIISLIFILPEENRNLANFRKDLEKSGFTAVKPYIDSSLAGNVSDPKIRSELSENFSVLAREYSSGYLTDDGKEVNIELANYMAAIVEDRLSQKEYQNWHSIFFWRKDINSKQARMIIGSNRMSEVAAERRKEEVSKKTTSYKSGKKYTNQYPVKRDETTELWANNEKFGITEDKERKIYRNLDNLNSADNIILERTIYFFESLGESATPYLVDHLLNNDKDVAMKRNVIYTLGRLGPNAKNAVPYLVPFLRDLDGDTRAITAITLGKIKEGTREAVPIIAMNQYDEDKWVSKSAREALEKIGTEKALIAIEEYEKSVKSK